MKKTITLTFAAALIALSSCSHEEKQIVDNEKPIAVTTNQPVTDFASGSSFSASGKLVAGNSANVSTRMMGYITSINTDVGRYVKKGQTLVNINNTDLKAKEGQVNAQISQAQANFNIAQKDYNRFKNLYDSQSASQKELDDMTARMEMARANLNAAQQMRNEIRSQYSYTNIAAPISGVVTQKYVNTGDMANPGMPLLTIEAQGTIQAQVLVSEAYINQIKSGMPVKVIQKSNGKELEGQVAEISLSAAQTGGQYVVKVNVQGKELLPGMYVNVIFPVEKVATQTASSTSVSVPNEALVHNGQLTGVYVISQSGTAVLRWIETGKEMGDQVEVLSGLNADEAYITSAQGKLYNGAKVVPSQTLRKGKDLESETKVK